MAQQQQCTIAVRITQSCIVFCMQYCAPIVPGDLATAEAVVFSPSSHFVILFRGYGGNQAKPPPEPVHSFEARHYVKPVCVCVQVLESEY